MKTRSMLFSQKDLAEYLLENYRGPQTKDYEILAALYLARITSSKRKISYAIGFPILQHTDKELEMPYSKETVKKIFESYIKEDTPVDMFLVPDESITYKPDGITGNAKGPAFQFKKISNLNKDGTKTIVTYLNEIIPKKYSKTNAALVLILQAPTFKGSVDLDTIKHNVAFDEYPFEQVLIFGGSGDVTYFGELWPGFGFDTYDKEQFKKILEK